MKTQTRILLAILFMMFGVFVGQSRAQDMERYIVTIQGPAEEAVIRAGGIVDHVFELIPAIAIRIPEAALPGLERNPLFVSIELDVEVLALPKPDTPPGQEKKPGGGGGEKEQPPQQVPWGVDRIDAEYAHSAGYTGLGVKVAVLDTGIDYKHPDLDDNCYGGVNVINPRKSYKDDNGHGTHVAGIIAAENNEIGVVGVAPDASLYGVKALDRNGSGWLSDIIAGLEWCVNNEMDIVNMSLGSNSDIQAFHDACDAASTKVILVAAAGNDGGAVDYPAAYNSVIAVSAMNISDGLAYFSSYGPEIEIAAPGVNILSTYKGGGYETHSGTSMAAPHVAGTLALSANIFATADDLGLPANQQGAGLVDAEQAALGTENGDN